MSAGLLSPRDLGPEELPQPVQAWLVPKVPQVPNPWLVPQAQYLNWLPPEQQELLPLERQGPQELR